MRYKRSGRHAKRQGFTLVELLVVISIIALLIAILLPSLRKARENAKRLACATNVRAITQASLTYAADDPNENVIPVNDFANMQQQLLWTYYAWGGKSGVGQYNLSDGSFKQSTWGPTDGMNAAKRPLNNVIYRGGLKEMRAGAGPGGIFWKSDFELDLPIYKCPSDVKFPGMHHKGWLDKGGSSYDYYGTSYACQPLWIGVYGLPPRDYIASNGVYLRPLSRVPNPANTIVYWENAARFATFYKFTPAAPNEVPCDCRSCFTTGANSKPFVAKGWHGQPWHFNVAFADGHVDWIKIQSYYMALGNKLVDLCGTGNLCQCVVVRGPGWQLDTMPSAWIITDNYTPTGVGARGKDNPDDDTYEVVP